MSDEEASDTVPDMSAVIMPTANTAFRRCLRANVHDAVRPRYSSSTASNISVARLLATPADEAERELYGFIRSIRKQKTRAFASIGDGSSLEPLQAMLTPEQAQR